jgi:hypothetical protein
MPAGINTYQTFTAGGYKFLSIGVRFEPDSEDLAWAQQVIDENPGCATIISTHDYQNRKGRDPNGRHIWDELVKKNPQVFMVLSGHINGAHRQTSIDNAGQPVFELLSDYQDYECSRKTGYDADYAHGGGFLRTMKFDVTSGRIEVKTYSPVIKKYMEDTDNQFTIECNFTDRFQPRPKAPTTVPTTQTAPPLEAARP